LCFKDGGKCEQPNWISLVDDVFNTYNQLVKNIPDLNVEFILDGTGSPNKPCLYNKWRPWVSTWIQNPKEALFSNDPTYAYDRYQVLNPSVDEKHVTQNIRELQRVKYGKFLNGSYPFLTWEPSNQTEILAVIDAYLDTTPELINKNGLRFAINLDPKMFEIYAGTRTGKAWNQVITGKQFRPQISVIDSNGPFITFLNVFTNCEMCTDLFFTTFVTDKPIGKLMQASPTVQVPKSSLGLITSLDTAQWNGDKVVLLSDQNARYGLFLLQGDSSMKQVVSGVLTNDGKPSTGNYSSSSLYVADNGLFITSVTQEQDCSLIITLWSVQSNASVSTYRTCISRAKSVIDITLDTTIVDSQLFGVLFYATSDNKIYGCTFHFEKPDKFHSTCSPSPVGVGSKPSASIVMMKDVIAIMGVHTDAFCYNSDDRNRKAAPSVCDLAAVSESGVMAYNYGSWHAFDTHFYNVNPVITSCHQAILHGTYDMGHNPNVDLFVKDMTIGMIEVHEAISDPLSGNMKCGRPVVQNKGTMIVDAWSLDVY
jgi:hypothetical protein